MVIVGGTSQKAGGRTEPFKMESRLAGIYACSIRSNPGLTIGKIPETNLIKRVEAYSGYSVCNNCFRCPKHALLICLQNSQWF